MSTDKTISVKDKHGFHYEVQVIHKPALGFSTAYYKGTPIADREAQKLREPFSDDDSEWEQYEESLADWQCEVEADLIRYCAEYFNNK